MSDPVERIRFRTLSGLRAVPANRLAVKGSSASIFAMAGKSIPAIPLKGPSAALIPTTAGACPRGDTSRVARFSAMAPPAEWPTIVTGAQPS